MSLVGNIVHHAVLNKRIDMGAVHDSEEQSDVARCYPGTRDLVINIATNWIGHGDKSIAWVTGFAGTGKTAILLSVAENCHREGLLAASFFSSPTHKRHIRTLIPTIIYQLSSNHLLTSSIGKDLTHFFSKNPEIFEKSLESQADSLLRLFKKPSQRRTDWPKVIIIDGFETVKVNGDDPESSEQRSSKQRQALAALLKLVVDEDFPFRILFGSRQESTITDFICDDATPATIIDLNILLGFMGSDGIAAYFDGKFEEIRRKPGFPQDPSSMGPSSYAYGWPPFNERQRNILMGRSAGYFPYASAIMGFIENGSQPPHSQLEAVLAQKEERLDFMAIMMGTENENPPPNPFASLDAMYGDALNSCSDPVKAATVLRLILAQGNSAFPAYFWNHLFESSRVDQDLTNGGFKRVLEPLRGLMRIPAAHDTTAPFTFCHRESLFKYLDDKRRCGKLWVFEDDYMIFMAKAYWDIVERKNFSSAPPGEQIALFGHLFNFHPYFADRSIHKAVMRCDADWWVGRCVSLKKREHLSLAFDVVHCYCPWYWCAPLCSRWRKVILRKCEEAGWSVPDITSLKAIYNNRTSFFGVYDEASAFRPPPNAPQ